jgi:sterol desaturase/sphingolipid hydroxylase (fatty acid hydroxylase superfamily)
MGCQGYAENSSLIIDYVLGKACAYLIAPFQSLDSFLVAISAPLKAVADVNFKTGWPYLISAVILAWWVFSCGKRKGVIPPTKSFKAFLFPREVFQHRSAILDYKFALVDLGMGGLLYMPLIAGLSMLLYKVLLYVIPPTPLFSKNVILTFIVGVVLVDLGSFLGHLMMHKVPILWKFHVVHHSAEVLTPATFYRVHPVETAVNALVGTILSALVAIVYVTMSHEELTLLSIAGVNAVTFLFLLSGSVLRHTHIWLSFGFMNWIIVSPAQHQIHHSQDPKHWDKNFGYMLAIWDGILGSLYVPRGRENIRYGVPDQDAKDLSTVTQLYFKPFRNALGLYRRTEIKSTDMPLQDMPILAFQHDTSPRVSLVRGPEVKLVKWNAGVPVPGSNHNNDLQPSKSIEMTSKSAPVSCD